MPSTAVRPWAIAATPTCHAAYMRPAATPASAPTCRIVVVAPLARRGCQRTCPRAWVSIAIPPIKVASDFYGMTRSPRKAQDRERSRAVDDRVIEAEASIHVGRIRGLSGGGSEMTPKAAQDGPCAPLLDVDGARVVRCAGQRRSRGR